MAADCQTHQLRLMWREYAMAKVHLLKIALLMVEFMSGGAIARPSARDGHV